MTLTLYSKPGCHLCDVMKSVVREVLRERSDVELREIDISTDRDLREQYELEIPVLLLDGRKIAKYRVTGEELTKILKGRKLEVESRK